MGSYTYLENDAQIQYRIGYVITATTSGFLLYPAIGSYVVNAENVTANNTPAPTTINSTTGGLGINACDANSRVSTCLGGGHRLTLPIRQLSSTILSLIMAEHLHQRRCDLCSLWCPCRRIDTAGRLLADYYLYRLSDLSHSSFEPKSCIMSSSGENRRAIRRLFGFPRHLSFSL